LELTLDHAAQLDIAITALMRVLTIDERRRSADAGQMPFNALDLETLSYVHRFPGAVAKDAAAFLGVRATTMQSVVDRLHRRGFLMRDMSALKGRAVALSLTEAGMAFEQTLHAQNLKNCRDMLACIDAAERDRFVQNITRIADMMSS
jgi:DNA-binding MarR family transcriptional regulator